MSLSLRSGAWMRLWIILGVALGCHPGANPRTCTRDGDLSVCAVVSDSNALRIEVSWTTKEPGSSWVTFGEGGAVSELGSDKATKEHHVVLYGLHPDTDVQIEAYTLLADGTELVSDELTIRTGSLPDYVPIGEVESHDPALTQPGWTLVNISNHRARWPGSAVIYDESGQPVWYHTSRPKKVDVRGDIDVSLTGDFTVLIGGSGNKIDPVEVSLEGEVLWEGPRQNDSHNRQHHHIQKLDDGSYLLLRKASDEARSSVIMDRVVQIDAEHRELWEWNQLDQLTAPDGAVEDYTHSNSVTLTDDALYVSSRQLSTLFKVDRGTGEILWRFGIWGSFPRSGATDIWFTHQHDPELQSDGSWLIYDNDGAPGDHTRVVQWTIDEAAGTAAIVWAFPGDFDVDPWYAEDWYSPIWGDVDRQPNGNVLVAAGTRVEGGESRVFEVTPDGEVVWAMRLPTPGKGVVGLYRAQRIPSMVDHKVP